MTAPETDCRAMNSTPMDGHQCPHQMPLRRRKCLHCTCCQVQCRLLLETHSDVSLVADTAAVYLTAVAADIEVNVDEAAGASSLFEVYVVETFAVAVSADDKY